MGEFVNNKHVANQYKRNRHRTPIQNKSSLNSSSNANAVSIVHRLTPPPHTSILLYGIGILKKHKEFLSSLANVSLGSTVMMLYYYFFFVVFLSY
jgi:hypothetical protein